MLAISIEHAPAILFTHTSVIPLLLPNGKPVTAHNSNNTQDDEKGQKVFEQA